MGLSCIAEFLCARMHVGVIFPMCTYFLSRRLSQVHHIGYHLHCPNPVAFFNVKDAVYFPPVRAQGDNLLRNAPSGAHEVFLLCSPQRRALNESVCSRFAPLGCGPLDMPAGRLGDHILIELLFLKPFT